MSRIVFILGAGASAHCGTPVMKDFLQAAEDLLRGGEVEEAREDFERVFDAVRNLRAMHSKINIDFHNVETVYTTFEMGRLLGHLPGIDDADSIEGISASLRKLIGYTLEKSMKLYGGQEATAPSAYYQFAGILESLIQQHKDFAVITFNYDLGLDYSLLKRRIITDYGLEGIDLNNRRHVRLLKLHGSLNWGRCSNKKCQKIFPYPLSAFHPKGNYRTLLVLSRLQTTTCPHCQCGSSLEEEPVLIPPTWNKTAFHGQIEQVWRNAANVLRDAEHIFVLGYSLPPTDWFFN